MSTKDFTSLLGRKSAGTNFSDIATAYFAGNNKKSNRNRNLLLASFLFNAKESKMQSQVMQNLQDLEDKKVIASAEAKANYDKQFKLQNQYDDIKSKGITEYYDADAEIAFDKYVTNLGMSTRFDGSNEDANQMKQKWKTNFAKNQYEKFKEIYDGETVERLSSFEAYAEPVLNKFKAERRKITSPTEVSLVHKVLNKVGIGKDRDQKLETNYVKAEENYNKLVEKGDAFSKAVARGATPILGITGVKSIKISMDGFDEEAARFNIGTDSPIYNASFKRFNNLSPEERTVGKAEEILVNNTINRYIVENEEKINAVTETFNANKQRLIDQGMTDDEISRELASQIRKATGITNRRQDLEDDAAFFGQLALDIRGANTFASDEERNNYIKKETNAYIQAQIDKGRGMLSQGRIAQNIRIATATQLAAEARTQPSAYRAAVRATPVSDELKLLLKENNPKAYEQLLELNKTGGLSDSRNNTRIENSQYSTIFFELQKRQYEENEYTNIKRLLDIATPGDQEIRGYESLLTDQEEKKSFRSNNRTGINPSYNFLDDLRSSRD
tara:strand:+ start:1143 stop:2819 length:1677 start_codon:yes stop_codon:yes gene_type:complete